MKRIELEHLIRASADIADDDEIVVVGSQAILGAFPNAPRELLVSNEADVYPKNHPARWNVIDGADRVFLQVALRHGLVNRATLLERLDATPLDPARREAARRRIEEA